MRISEETRVFIIIAAYMPDGGATVKLLNPLTFRFLASDTARNLLGVRGLIEDSPDALWLSRCRSTTSLGLTHSRNPSILPSLVSTSSGLT